MCFKNDSRNGEAKSSTIDNVVRDQASNEKRVERPQHRLDRSWPEWYHEDLYLHILSR
jgi:hypothetical protein